MSERYEAAVAAGQAAYNQKNYDRAKLELEKAVSIRAANPSLLNLYAECCKRTGDNETAWDMLRRVLIVEPANMRAASQFALLTVKTGRKDKERLVQHARELNKANENGKRGLFGRVRRAVAGKSSELHLPGMTEAQSALFQRAQESIKGGDFFSAVFALESLRKELHDDTRVLFALAETYVGLGEAEPAHEVVEAALANGAEGVGMLALQINSAVLNTDNARAAELLGNLSEEDCARPEILVAEARLLVAEERNEEALAVVDRLEKIDDTNAAAASIRARILSGQGKFEEALPWAEAWSRRAPRASVPFSFAASNRTLKKDSFLFERANALIDNPKISQNARAGTYFALMQCFKEAGEHEAAFDYLLKANATADVVYDAEAAEEQAAAIKMATGAARFAEAGDAERGRGLIFVCGLPRSGSTLASQILSAHPECVSIGESPITEDCLRAALEKGYPENFGQPDADLFTELGQRYLRKLPDYAREARFVVDKELTKYQHLGLLQLMLPGARIVHTRRDPMDVCYSMFCHNFLGWPAIYRFDTLAHFHALHDDIMGYWADVLPRAPHIVQYEDMVADTEAETRLMLDAVGMPFHEDCLNFQQASSSVSTASVYQVRQKVYSSSIGAWKRYEAELAPLKQALEARGVSV